MADKVWWVDAGIGLAVRRQRNCRMDATVEQEDIKSHWADKQEYRCASHYR